MRLYEIPLAPVCGRVRFALELKGLSYERVVHTPGVTDWKLGRVGERVMVPTLVDGTTVVQGSDEILAHIEHKVPEPNLLGVDEQERAAITRYVDVFREVGPQLRTDLLVRMRKEIVGVSKESPLGWMPSFVRLPAARWAIDRFSRKYDCDEADVQNIRDAVTLTLRSIIPQLRSDGFLVGDRLTDADISISALGLLFRPPGDRWVEAGHHTRACHHADWFPVDLAHAFEVWRDALFNAHRKTGAG